MSSHPAKRQRTEDAPIVRSDIWYEDGSLVLQAQKTQFRVHWGVLAKQSSFFRDMQAQPLPSDRPTVDGCPVVELPEDVDEVEHLLTAVYDSTFLAQIAVPLSSIAALIRLGRKYDFQNLLHSAVDRLTFENPSTLEEYDARLVDGKRYAATRIVGYPGLIYDMLTVARENNVLSALPCAYYRAAHLHKPETLFEGISRPDGTSSSLAPVDQQRCILGREKLIRAQTQEGYTLEWLRAWNADGCMDPAGCNKWRASMVRKYLDHLTTWAFTPFMNIRTTVCNPCSKHIEQSMVAGRKKIWQDLPSFFDLSPWSELKNEL
ncbi:hypothetical protein K438DRAFT_1769440 [Mycena galopus ATCC 62051]|nr:hypothetical protein K438DRAFT_1769440 [Mycena galopus ATCC 62051]